MKAKYEGEVFNNHLVTSFARERKTPSGYLIRYWNTRCLKCGHESTRTQENLRKKGCHVCLFEAKREAKRNNPRKHYTHNKYIETLHSAQGRGLTFKVSKEEIDVLLHLPCAYCGIEGPGGIDRVDNNRGYETGNIAPCCKTCNMAKRDRSVDEFIMWARRLVEFQDWLDKSTPLD